jgi:ketosteroid isomerase-like protein
MEAASNGQVFQRVFELYATGRTGEVLDHVDERVEWGPTVLDSSTYHGHAGVRTWAASMRRAWKSITVVYDDLHEIDDCVVTNGRIAAFDHGGELVIDSPLACVAEFRDHMVVRACAFVSVDDAMAWVSDRRELP